MIIVILTCHNRKTKTVDCINSLVLNNPNIDFKFVVVDDNSTDGTQEALRAVPYDITVIEGDGHLFWNGGMHKGIAYVKEMFNEVKYEYVLLVNDDVSFRKSTISQMVEDSVTLNSDVVVGTTYNHEGELSYGGIKFASAHFVKYKVLDISDALECDTFNANCVLIRKGSFVCSGDFDSYYKHAMGDFDYGIQLKKAGNKLVHTRYYVGECDQNEIEGTWKDVQLSRRERIRRKEEIKGLPLKDWFHFVNKNFSFGAAVYHMITPYIRILLRK